MSTTLVVEQLADSIGLADLQHLFHRHGAVMRADLFPAAGVAGRFGVVEMDSIAAANAAIRELNGHDAHGRKLRVRWPSAVELTDSGHPAMFGPMNVIEPADPPPNDPTESRGLERPEGAI